MNITFNLGVNYFCFMYLDLTDDYINNPEQPFWLKTYLPVGRMYPQDQNIAARILVGRPIGGGDPNPPPPPKKIYSNSSSSRGTFAECRENHETIHTLVSNYMHCLLFC